MRAVVWAALGAAALNTSAFAQSAPASAQNPVANSITLLAACFNSSVAEQFVSKAELPDVMSERAFLSCKTEEDMLRAQLNIFGVNPATEAAVARVKLKLKAQVRDTFGQWNKPATRR